MGRRIPLNEKPLIHPLLSFSLLVVGIAAAMATITALCGSRFRRRTSPPSSAPPPFETAEKPDLVDSTAITMTMTSSPPPKAAEPVESEDILDNKLPLPPAMKQMGESYSCRNMTKSSPYRKTSMNLSMKLPRSLSLARREENRQRKEQLKMEDSVWMKTIILGEKCKVPDEEDAVIYDGKGKRISAYHPRTPSRISLSMGLSFNEPDLLPPPEEHVEGNQE
ncbi:hypothetical protein I3843_16G029000 [Carya illinoinensis]|uniref:Uncharacterized protein n=1 Tax=Carya illinoinensis TaxID=32201 RepID=A0A8T1N301_CARIL|nr:hypothetical protein CIPAW_16G027300 [Carya illinoinensis]KAG6671874.1 hypothetical protein I3842_16G026300 [Carya illinoinensis]KAG7941231.1 hypothetical protein I3843_16G029000 [Carya illinoinensis]